MLPVICVHYPTTKRAGWLLALMGPGWGGVDSVIVWLLWSASVPPPHAPAIGSASLIY